MTLQDRVAQVLHAAGIGGQVESLSPVAPIISPMARAADWQCIVVRTKDDACFVKLPAIDIAEFVSTVDAAAGARHAARLGLGPGLRSEQPDALVFEWLPPPWREARLGDLAQPAVLNAVLDAKRAFHHGPELARRWDVFDQIDRYTAMPDLPAEATSLLPVIIELRGIIAQSAAPPVPCHCDGVASNVMLHSDGRVRLVDFDCAGMADPHYDLATVLNEVCATDDEWQQGFAAAFGEATPRGMALCRAYAIADDFFWALWGFTRHAIAARPDLEFLKYGAWRLLRCRMALQRPELWRSKSGWP